MNEIKCPNCGEGFSIDENYYNKIVMQVRAKEIKQIKSQMEKDIAAKRRQRI